MVDPLHFLEEKQLLGFLHLNKTELSCMENPLTFVSQLRDYNLIPEENYKKISRMKSKERIRSAMYNALDRIEKEQPKLIHRFWRCAFKETIINKYPTLRLLRNSLFDGSYADSALLEGVENEDDRKRKELSDEEEEVVKKLKKKKKIARLDYDDDDEQAGPSSPVTPRTRKKPKKLCFSTPLKKGEKGDIWTWAIYKVQLPVTCGDHKGTLNRDRLAKGEKCILVDKQWYTPSEFERLAGRASCKNWKLSIRCRDIPLGKLMQEGHLKTTGFKRGSKAKKSLFPYEETLSGSEEETEDDGSDDQFASSTGRSSSDSGSAPGSSDEDSEEQNKLQSEAIRDSRNRVLRVSCEDITGLLHTKRFASGTCGKSIRTETRWMTPVDFVKEASCQTDVSWQRDIKCEGQPLGDLVKAKVLEIHSLLCTCSLCVPDSEALENEKNDDECWICRSEGVLVECDECPRSFHQKCHLPHIEDTLLNNRLWMCTLCVFRKNLDLYPELEMEAAMSRTTSGHMLHCQYLLLGLYRADEEQIFTTDPCLILRDYTSVIETPMWLGQIAVKLQEKKYQTVGEFVSDVQLIFANCASYNRDNPHFRAIGEKMEQLFERELKSVFKIREVTLNS